MRPFRVISAACALHSWNSWDCGDQVTCEATEMPRQILDVQLSVKDLEACSHHLSLTLRDGPADRRREPADSEVEC